MRLIKCNNINFVSVDDVISMLKENSPYNHFGGNSYVDGYCQAFYDIALTLRNMPAGQEWFCINANVEFNEGDITPW